MLSKEFGMSLIFIRLPISAQNTNSAYTRQEIANTATTQLLACFSRGDSFLQPYFSAQVLLMGQNPRPERTVCHSQSVQGLTKRGYAEGLRWATSSAKR